MLILRPWLFKLLPNPPLALALWPFVLAQRPLQPDELNHERIHHRQQVELLLIPFYLLYLLNYLALRLKGKRHDAAYRNIVFEREAFTNDANLSYLAQRGLLAWWAYW